MHILASLQDDGLETEGQELEGGEKTGRPCTDYDHRFGTGDILVRRDFVRNIGFETVVVSLDPVPVDDIVPCIDGASGDDAGRRSVRE